MPRGPKTRTARASSQVAPKRCFVISPIDKGGSATREHADDVFDYIIKPAMEDLDIIPERSDHLHEPGLISKQMLRAILEYDLCIAVLTFNNPNVFYELAIAHAANRPVIILLAEDGELPFDIKDHRCVHYDLKPRSLADRVYSTQIVKHVKAVEAGGWRETSLYGASVAASTEAPCTVLPTAQEFGVAADWLKLLEQTEHNFAISGINLHDWRKTPRFTEALANKAQDGCRVRVLLMHADNPVFPGLINDLAPTSSFAEVRLGLAETEAFFDKLGAAHDHITVRSVRNGCPHFNLTLTDRIAVAIPYLYSTRTAMCPVLRCPAHSPLMATFQQEFEALWDGNDGR